MKKIYKKYSTIVRNCTFTVSAFIMVGIIANACQEWQPVFSPNGGEVAAFEPQTLVPTETIAQFKSRYTSAPVTISENVIIGGQVISSDKAGNLYRSLVIQDGSSGLEIKIGKTGLYNDYKPGQWIYVKCKGLTLGSYEKMLQLGLNDPTKEYETTYIDHQGIIKNKIIKGEMGPLVVPKELQETDLTKEENLSCLVKLKGLKYGEAGTGVKRIFCLLNVNPYKEKKDKSNRIFLSEATWGVTTWAFSKEGMIKHLDAGDWDTAELADKSKTVEEVKDELKKYATAGIVSQYFSMGGTTIQVRTSGFCRFADREIKKSVLDQLEEVEFVGILGRFRDDLQFTLLEEPEWNK